MSVPGGCLFFVRSDEGRLGSDAYDFPGEDSFGVGCDVSAQASLDRFTDGDQTSPYAVETIQWAVAKGLLTGRDDHFLAPGAHATRAEAAAILGRFAALYGE